MEKTKEKDNVRPFSPSGAEKAEDKEAKKAKGKKILRWVIGVVVLALLITGAWFLNSLRFVTVANGKIDGSVKTSGPKVTGRILEVKVKVGDTVKKGDVLAVIDSRNQRYTIDQLTETVALKQAKLDDLTAGTRIEQIQQLEAQSKAAKAQWDLLKSGSRPEQKKQAVASLKIAKASAESATLTYQNAVKAYNDGKAISDMGDMSENDLNNLKLKMDTAERTMNTAKYQVESAQAQVDLLTNGNTVQSVAAAKDSYDAVKAQLDMAKAGATKPTIAMALADLKASQIQLEQAKSALDDYFLRATADGVVIKVSFVEGDNAVPGNTAVSIVDFNDLTARVGIDERDIEKVKLGQEARLTLASYPGVTFYGKVVEVGLATELTLDPFSTSGTTGSSSDDNQVVPVKVKLEAKGRQILPGVTVDGKIKVR